MEVIWFLFYFEVFKSYWLGKSTSFKYLFFYHMKIHKPWPKTPSKCGHQLSKSAKLFSNVVPYPQPKKHYVNMKITVFSLSEYYNVWDMIRLDRGNSIRNLDARRLWWKGSVGLDELIDISNYLWNFGKQVKARAKADILMNLIFDILWKSQQSRLRVLILVSMNKARLLNRVCALSQFVSVRRYKSTSILRWHLCFISFLFIYFLKQSIEKSHLVGTWNITYIIIKVILKWS